MKKPLSIIAAMALTTSASAQIQEPPKWSPEQVDELQGLIDDTSVEGLKNCNISNASEVDPVQTMVAAKQLAQAYLEGCNRGVGRSRWHIESRDNLIDNDRLLRLALFRNELDKLFGAYRPQNPNYQALRTALQAETDPERRRILSLNMERWRWMPLHLGETYLIVNAASFEVSLWKNHKKLNTWPVIVGKPTSPTPIFDTKVSGVILNPWWEIPTSIVAESVGALVRNRPAEARRRGYIVQNGRYRQRPGPGNALGQMKLIMPNPYSVKLHDTSNRKLFANEVRTYSHGCVRVGDAIGFAKTLLADDKSSEAVDAILAKRTTESIKMSATIPIYIAYFTAERSEDGSVIYYPDVYKRDSIKLTDAGVDPKECYL